MNVPKLWKQNVSYLVLEVFADGTDEQLKSLTVKRKKDNPFDLL